MCCSCFVSLSILHRGSVRIRRNILLDEPPPHHKRKQKQRTTKRTSRKKIVMENNNKHINCDSCEIGKDVYNIVFHATCNDYYWAICKVESRLSHRTEQGPYRCSAESHEQHFTEPRRTAKFGWAVCVYSRSGSFTAALRATAKQPVQQGSENWELLCGTGLVVTCSMLISRPMLDTSTNAVYDRCSYTF